jgi:DNA-binding SARP family transcriptional activator
LEQAGNNIYLETIRMYMMNGRMHEAVRLYLSLEQTLKQELRLLPDPRIAEAIRNGDPLALLP